MFNWFDLMQQAQKSAGFDALTRQFQLSDVQSQKAMAAFMPAFAMGLQHLMASGNASPFFQPMMNEAYRNFWQAAGFPLPPQARQEGRRLLDQLFGSDVVSRRVAHQAADFAGVSVDTMQQLLPLLTGIVAGTMSQWMMAQAIQTFTPPAGPAQDSRAAANPWAELWAGWMKGASQPEQKPAPNPFEDMMAPFLRMQPPPKEAEQKPPPPSSQWEEAMEKGREMQAQYLASLQSIFSEAWKADPKKP